MVMLLTRETEALEALGNLTDGFFLSVLRASRDCIKIIELDGSVLFVNDNGLCILEVEDASAVVGLDWVGFWPEESRYLVQQAIENAKAGDHIRFEACCPTFSGRIKWWDVAVSPITDDQGKVSRILAISRDVTGLVERERHAHEREVQILHLAERQQRELNDSRRDAAAEAKVEEQGLAPDITHDSLFRLHEEKRLEALLKTGLLDSVEEERFDHLTKLAAEALNVPTALVSLVDRERQWFKSRHNFEAKETSRGVSFCAQAIQHPDEVMIVEDARNDSRVCDNPLVHTGPKIAFYAGVPLVTNSGFPIGTLCVIDYKPRTLSEREKSVLRSIAGTVMTEIELIAKERERSDLDIINLEMRHRMSNTYARVSSLVSMIGRSEQDKKKFMSKLQDSIGALSRLQSDIAFNDWDAVGVGKLVPRALGLVGDTSKDSAFKLDLDEDLNLTAHDAFMMTLAVQELASNASKHGAFTIPNGGVHVSVKGTATGFDFLWDEHGMTKLDELDQARTGFGSELLTRIIPQTMSGKAELGFAAGSGVRYALYVTTSSS